MFVLGVDIGQRRDPAALAVVERVDRGRQFQTPELEFMLVRYLDRVALGTPYPEVVEQVRWVVTDEQIAGQCAIAVDATGVGIPLVEAMRTARLGCEVAAVTITGGDRETQRGNDWTVPKQDLIAGLQLLLEKGQLKIAQDLREGTALARELRDLRASDGRGRVRYGADKAGQHDDLVVALALAVWRAMKGAGRQNSFGTQRIPGI